MGRRRDDRVPPYLQPLLEEAAERWGTTPAMILSPDRHQATVAARATVAYALHRGQLSSVRIGRLLGRDHTSVLNAIKRTESLATMKVVGDSLYSWVVGWCMEHADHSPEQLRTVA